MISLQVQAFDQHWPFVRPVDRLSLVDANGKRDRVVLAPWRNSGWRLWELGRTQMLPLLCSASFVVACAAIGHWKTNSTENSRAAASFGASILVIYA